MRTGETMGVAEKKIRFRLWTKFVLGVFTLECALLLAIVFVVEQQMRQSVLEEFLKRGLSVAENLAAINTNYAATYNYLNIEQNVKQVVEKNHLLYAAAVFFDGEVASYVGPLEIRKTILAGPMHERTMNIDRNLVQYGVVDGRDYCDIAVPIFLKDENFGSVRCGFSLHPIGEAVIRTRKKLVVIGIGAVLFSCMAAIFLARRITRPVTNLVQSVEEISKGNYDHSVPVETNDEIALLGFRFEQMKGTIKEQIRQLMETNTETLRINEKLAYEIDVRKQVEGELRTAIEDANAANIAKTLFLNNVSHELRTPMNGILGLTELILDTDLSAEQRDHARMLYRSGERLTSVINGILNFSRLDRDDFQLAEHNFNLLDLIEETIALLAVDAHEKNLELNCLVDEDVPLHLVGDAERLRQIVSIVVGNAIKFTDAGEISVTVETIADGGDRSIRFEVRDTGIGIKPEVSETIFDIFTQSDASSSRQHEGLGVGLAVARRLTDLLGGKIGGEGLPGGGAGFWFMIPARIQTPLDRESSGDASSLAGLKVLVVDDNETCRFNLGHHFDAWGVTYETAETGGDGLTRLQEAVSAGRPFDLVMLDTTLAEIPAPVIARRIGSHPATTNVNIVMLDTACGRESVDEGSFSANVTSWVKPVRRSRLFASLAALSGKSKETGCGNEEGTWPKARMQVDARIMIAEDNPINLALAGEILRRLGCTIIEAHNGLEALEIFMEEGCDIIAMDCQMPMMDGYEATRKIRDHEKNRFGDTPRVPIFALTAHCMEGDRERCLEAGMDDYLAKPFNSKDLVDMLKRWVPAGKIRGALPVVAPASQGPSKEQAPSDEAPAAAHGNPSAVDIDAGGIDQAQFQAMTGMCANPESMKRILGIFLKDSHVRMETMREAVDQSDMNIVALQSHALKSSSASLGARKLADLLCKLEKTAREKDCPGACRLFETIDREYHNVHRTLETEMQKTG